MKKIAITILVLFFTATGVTFAAQSNEVTTPTSRNDKVKVPIQPPSKRVLRAIGYYTIFSVSKKKIYFDAGKDENIPRGAQVKIYRQVIKRNPVTGKVYNVKKLIGTGKVISVDTDYSIARIEEKYTRIRIGDLVYVDKFVKRQVPFYKSHEIFYELKYTDFDNLTNYMDHSLGFIYTISSLRVGLQLDYILTRPQDRDIFLTNYIFQLVTPSMGISIVPIFCIATNDVTWGTRVKLILGNLFATHLSVSYMNIDTVGWESSLEGAFKLSKNLIVASETLLSTFPDTENKKLITQIKFTGLFNPVAITIGGGFGGKNADQIGPFISAKMVMFVGGEE